MTKEELLEKQSRWLKSIAHPVRLSIIKGLIEDGKCNVNTMKDKLDLPQSTVSQHLQILRNVGIVKGQKAGTTVYYHIDNEGMADFVRLIDKVASF